MRCLSIARAFSEQGDDVLFVTADHRGDELIRSANFKSTCLDGEWTLMESEIPRIEALIDEYEPYLVLVDSYFVTEKYLHNINKMVPVAYIDDINESCWDVKYLINYNIFGKTIGYSRYDDCDTELILGPKYAPLRDEFVNMPHHIVRQCVSDILVSAGGADPERITERVIHDVCPKFPDSRFHFTVGVLNPRIEAIKRLERGNVILHINEQHMARLMRSCDISISAAGSTLYELCAAGVPTITYILADNQRMAAEQFEVQGIMLNAGDCRNDVHFLSRLNVMLARLINDIELRMLQTKRMQSLVDGFGARRIVEAMRE